MRNLVEEHNTLPPEDEIYPDAGCEFSPTCLNCRLPVCIYDEPGGKRVVLKRRRAAEMCRLHYQEGKNVKELAAIFKVSIRTVQRVLKESK